MKQYFISLALTILISLSGLSQIQTPAASPEQTLNQVIGLSSVSVQYSRPAMRGRTIFGDLVPLDKIWRTGANTNTIINFDNDVSVGGEALKSGSYALYSKGWMNGPFIFITIRTIGVYRVLGMNKRLPLSLW